MSVPGTGAQSETATQAETTSAPSLTNLSLSDIFSNVCNAFVGTIADMGGNPAVITNDDYVDPIQKSLFKENRYMYLALLVLVTMIVGNILFE
jgi:hypothetical protein